MSIEKAVREALEREPRTGRFADQLNANRAFTVRMELAGVAPRKPEFTIPLMERISHCR